MTAHGSFWLRFRKTADDNAEEILKEAKKITNSASGSKQTSFRPFIADADKQNRYEKYLKLVMAGKKGLQNLPFS